jgi:uncharacterized membrane protein
MTVTTPTERTTRWPVALAAALAAATVLAEIAYPLTEDAQLGRLSGLTVLLACAACLVHAVATAGRAWTAAFVLVVVVGAFAAEVLGVATGFPFGTYDYAHSLGPLVAGVPLLVPFAWLMMAYPCWLMARRLVSGRLVAGRWMAGPSATGRLVATGLTTGAAMAAWDVFLDPQMVAAGHWTWADPTPSLPGVAAVPLTNLAGWLGAASVVMCAATAAARRWAPPADGPGPLTAATPVTLVAWTWLGGIVANAVFFDRPAVAVWGGLLFGLFAGPYLLLVRSR